MLKYKFLEKSPFQFWEVRIILPRIKWGKVSFVEDYDSSLEDGHKYSVEFRTDIGFYKDNHFQSVWLILLGFGCSLAVQDGY